MADTTNIILEFALLNVFKQGILDVKRTIISLFVLSCDDVLYYPFSFPSSFKRDDV